MKEGCSKYFLRHYSKSGDMVFEKGMEKTPEEMTEIFKKECEKVDSDKVYNVQVWKKIPTIEFPIELASYRKITDKFRCYNTLLIW
jgi:hypothetical protein